MANNSRTLSVKDLVVCGAFGALIFVAAFTLGSALLIATGTPATGTIVNMLVIVLIAVIGLKIVDKFGAAIVMLTIEGTITVPTLTNGPPGLHKILMLFIIGLIVDIILLLTKRSNRGYIFAGFITGIDVVVFIYLSLLLLGLPGEEKLRAIVIPLSIVSGIMSGLGAYIGLNIYDKKLKHLSIIQNLKS